MVLPAHSPHSARRPQQGFTLVEIAVVLIVVATLLGFGLSMIGSVSKAHAVSLTQDKARAIREAIIAYLAQHGQAEDPLRGLPCPVAFPVTNGAAPTVGGATACANFAGALPFQELGLPREAALDAWGNYFIYRIAPRWQAGQFASNYVDPAVLICAEQEAPGAVSSFSSSGAGGAGGTAASAGCAAAGSAVSNAAVLLISAGENGLGAWTAAGTRNALPTAAQEVNNLWETQNSASVGAAGVTVKAPTQIADEFDDVVLAVPPSELLMPLYRMGALQPAEAELKIVLNRMHAQIRAKGDACATPSYTRLPADGAALPTQSGPWGGVLEYSRCNSGGVELPASADVGQSVTASEYESCAASNAYALKYPYVNAKGQASNAYFAVPAVAQSACP